MLPCFHIVHTSVSEVHVLNFHNSLKARILHTYILMKYSRVSVLNMDMNM
ncbi:hypothetical protein Fmac_026558 [Flemingia macrophylla]|uniref:Uncharacterized protein n=1 Tax=Flemingia macrophylla TaxID=520843 RepID=A0ABD1LF83_9FABA